MKNYELRITNYELRSAKIIWGLFFLIAAAFSANAQSTDQNSPTPIKTNEISGRIAARDLGDARLTSYFYTFDGTQGDVFINVVTTNFNGDIDIFTAGDLRPLAKITAYADSPNNETGRVVYLRQPLKLILRIEGRTPNDDAATFQMKFAGSFLPSTAIAEAVAEPEVKTNNQTDVRVNSVGTIIEVKPKPTPTPKEIVAKVEKPVKARKPKAAKNKPNAEVDKPETKVEEPVAPPDSKAGTVAETAEHSAKEMPVKETAIKETTEEQPKKVESSEETKPPTAALPEQIAEKKPEAEKAAEKELEKPSENKVAETESKIVKKPKEKKNSNAVQPVEASELANINLIILFKDGTKIERPMSEILKFSVDKGILTVISKDGAIGRYSILDVEKMTIE